MATPTAVPVDIAMSYGPILFGGAVAFMLSGIVSVQCIIFFKLYGHESLVKSSIVATVWTLDVSQTSFILASFFDYFITNFGLDRTSEIPWSIALTILATAMQTCVVHLFYAAKIFRSSGRNWFITGPIILLASLRLIAAVAATVKMLVFKSWIPFLSGSNNFLFTAGLSLSAVTDAVITLCLCHYLRKIKKCTASSVMRGVLDTLTVYTLENGLITCLLTVGALLFWLFDSQTTFALTLHFIIGKLYPNSLLVLLNARKSLREMHSGDPGVRLDGRHHLAAYYAHFPHRVPGAKSHIRGESTTQAELEKGLGSGLDGTLTLERRLTLTQGPVAVPQPQELAVPAYAYGYPAFKMHEKQEPMTPPVQVRVQRTVTRARDRPRDSDGLTIYSEYTTSERDAPSFDLDEAAQTDRKKYNKFPNPASFPSPPRSEARSIGMTSLHWRRALP